MSDPTTYGGFDKIFHDGVDPIKQLLLMARGNRPIGSGNFIRTMFAHIIEGRLRHPAITEAIRKDFLRSREYRNAAKCAIRYQSAPKAGGIEIMTLSSLPQCDEIKLSADKKFLSASFNGIKYWLPVGPVTQEEILYLIYSSILNAPRLCIDITAYSPFYTIHLDGGIGYGLDIA